jgi:hypothetical protein
MYVAQGGIVAPPLLHGHATCPLLVRIHDQRSTNDAERIGLTMGRNSPTPYRSEIEGRARQAEERWHAGMRKYWPANTVREKGFSVRRIFDFVLVLALVLAGLYLMIQWVTNWLM